MDQPASSQLEIIIPAFRMHSHSFLSILEGISETDAQKRIEGKTNHLVWMAGNFVNVRYALGQVMGLEDKDPHNDLFYMGKSFSETAKYPSLKELTTHFHDISPKLYKLLLAATPEQLAQPVPVDMGIPFVEENLLNFIGMCIGREDYLSGQMALVRRILDYPSVRYDVIHPISY